MIRVITMLAAMTAGSSVLATNDGKGDSLHPRVKLQTTLGDIVIELDGGMTVASTCT